MPEIKSLATTRGAPSWAQLWIGARGPGLHNGGGLVTAHGYAFGAYSCGPVWWGGGLGSAGPRQPRPGTARHGQWSSLRVNSFLIRNFS